MPERHDAPHAALHRPEERGKCGKCRAIRSAGVAGMVSAITRRNAAGLIRECQVNSYSKARIAGEFLRESTNETGNFYSKARTIFHFPTR